MSKSQPVLPAAGEAVPPLSDEHATAIHRHPFVRACLLEYVARPCDQEAAAVVHAIFNAASGLMLGARLACDATSAVPPDHLPEPGKMIEAAKRAMRAMEQTAQTGFDGDEYHEALRELKAHLAVNDGQVASRASEVSERPVAGATMQQEGKSNG